MLLKQVEETISRYGILAKNDSIVVAVSGGVDSVTLLHVLWVFKDKYHWSLYIAHLNHALRGQESDSDEEFVKKVALRYCLPCTIEKVDIGSYAKKHKLSLEEAGRILRYEFLNKTADKVGANKIALAHNADDQVETVLMFLLRGTGKTGLAAMPLARDKIVRPLLNSWRSEIEEYVRQNLLTFRTDSSNLKSDFRRNKIRLELLPLLEKDYNPRVRQHLLNISVIERQEDTYLDQKAAVLARRCLRPEFGQAILNVKVFLKYKEWLQRRIIRSIGDFSFTQIEKILELAQKKGPAKELHLSDGWRASRAYNEIFFGRQTKKRHERIIIKRRLKIPGVTEVGPLGQRFFVNLYPKDKNFKLIKNKQIALLDADTIRDGLILRTRQPGDRFRPFGLKGTKKLKDYFSEQKISLAKRELIPVISDQKKIVWLAGLGRIDERVKITGKTKNILEIKIEKIPQEVKKIE